MSTQGRRVRMRVSDDEEEDGLFEMDSRKSGKDMQKDPPLANDKGKGDDISSSSGENPDEGIYRVERILDRKKRQGRWKYHLKWFGYEDTTWEDQDNLIGCEDLLREYEESLRLKQLEDGKQENSTSSIKANTKPRNKRTLTPADSLRVASSQSTHSSPSHPPAASFITTTPSNSDGAIRTRRSLMNKGMSSWLGRDHADPIQSAKTPKTPKSPMTPVFTPMQEIVTHVPEEKNLHEGSLSTPKQMEMASAPSKSLSPPSPAKPDTLSSSTAGKGKEVQLPWKSYSRHEKNEKVYYVHDEEVEFEYTPDSIVSASHFQGNLYLGVRFIHDGLSMLTFYKARVLHKKIPDLVFSFYESKICIT